jgi:hypothetical protein
LPHLTPKIQRCVRDALCFGQGSNRYVVRWQHLLQHRLPALCGITHFSPLSRPLSIIRILSMRGCNYPDRGGNPDSWSVWRRRTTRASITSFIGIGLAVENHLFRFVECIGGESLSAKESKRNSKQSRQEQHDHMTRRQHLVSTSCLAGKTGLNCIKTPVVEEKMPHKPAVPGLRRPLPTGTTKGLFRGLSWPQGDYQDRLYMAGSSQENAPHMISVSGIPTRMKSPKL